MTSQTRLTREIIIQTLVDALEPLAYVHAFWEGGAAAFNRIDEWSDIDLYLVVDDKKVGEAFLTFENALRLLSPIKQKYEVLQLPWPRVYQTFYKLEDASEYLVIDLVVLVPSSPEKFLEPEIHGSVVFYFNKSNKAKRRTLNKDASIKKLQERLERLQASFDMFSIFVQKEINRRNYLEAMSLYHTLILAPLTEALRIRYNPIHHDFKMRYIHYEVPSEIIKKLEHLFFVRDENDLQEKYYEAVELFKDVMSEIDQKEIERLVRMSE